MNTHQFCWTAQIHSVLLSQGLAAGSAPSTILLNVAYIHDGDDELASSLLDQPVAVNLGKSLRRMMRGYLDVGDWIRIVGRWEIDVSEPTRIWHGREIFKLSAEQVVRAKALPTKVTSSSKQNKPKAAIAKTKVKAKPNPSTAPTQILICQQSSCRKRGSGAVSRAVSDAIAASGKASQIAIRPIGCVKNCKLGPNVIVRSARSQSNNAQAVHSQQSLSANGRNHSRVNGRHEKVTPQRMSEIIKALPG